MDEHEDDDELLDDGWVQQDEAKQRMNRRLKRVGYRNWRKSLDAATRYELEKKLPSTLLETGFEIEHEKVYLTGSQQSHVSSSPPVKKTVLTSSSGDSHALLPGTELTTSTKSSSASPRPVPSSSSSDPPPTPSSPTAAIVTHSDWSAGRANNTDAKARVQRRRSIGILRGKELDRAFQRESEVCGVQNTSSADGATVDGSSKKQKQQVKGGEPEGGAKAAPAEKKKKKKTTKKAENEESEKKGSFLLWKRTKSERNRRTSADDEKTGNESTASVRTDEKAASELSTPISSCSTDQPQTVADGKEDEPDEAGPNRRDRSGTMALFAAMSAGYQKQQQQKP